MSLLRLLNLLFFGPKVTLPRTAFTDAAFSEFDVIGNQVQSFIQNYYQGRGLRIRVVSAGSFQAENVEIQALTNAYYDIERFGITFVQSPLHADVLFVTGPVTRYLHAALLAAYEATPKPCLVVAIGDGACTGGIWKDAYAIVGPVDAVIPVHVRIPGDPPNPTAILTGLLQALQLRSS